MTELIDVTVAKDFVMGNYPNDPVLKHAVVTLLDQVPKVKALPCDGVEMIRIRYAAAKGVEKALLGDVLRLLEGTDGT